MTDRGPGPLMQASPFLVFAVTVEQAGEQLASASYVPEWVGVGRRTPLFDVPRLREFMSSPWRRFFLAELLASYTRVASGSVLVATRRGFRRQRFSELDPVHLAGLLDVVPDAERPGVLRRLGDLASVPHRRFPRLCGSAWFWPGGPGPSVAFQPGDGHTTGRRWASGPATCHRRGCGRGRLARTIGPAVVPGRFPATPGPRACQRRRDQRDAGALQRCPANSRCYCRALPVLPPRGLVRDLTAVEGLWDSG